MRVSAAPALALAALLCACAPEEVEPAVEPERQVEVGRDVVESAAWSLDGARLAVAWTRHGRSRVYGLFAPDDSIPPAPGRGIPLTGQGRSPSWSPDGLWLAFSTTREGNSEIYRGRPDGTGPENLTGHRAEDAEPAYAPTGGRLAFVSDRDAEEPRIWIADGDVEEARPLESGAAGPHHAPAWSPDGQRLAFTVGEGPRRTVWVSGADGAEARAIGPGASPSWSADGATLYYDRGDSIFVRAPERGAAERFVTEGRASAPSPDGRWLAFVRGNQETAALYLLDLDRLEATRITP